MFFLRQLKQELNRSKKISYTSNEISTEVKNQYKALDEKYSLHKERVKLESIPRLRRAIVNNFIKDLRETESLLNHNSHNPRLKKATIQRFLCKLESLNDNKKSATQSV